MKEKKTKSPETSGNRCTVKKELAGKRFFFLYAAVYGCFILVSVIRPDIMGIKAGGFNIAILYGMSLILFAVLLAFIYNNLCTRAEERTDQSEDKSNADENREE